MVGFQTHKFSKKGASCQLCILQYASEVADGSQIQRRLRKAANHILQALAAELTAQLGGWKYFRSLLSHEPIQPRWLELPRAPCEPGRRAADWTRTYRISDFAAHSRSGCDKASTGFIEDSPRSWPSGRNPLHRSSWSSVGR